ncbi:uncharacterized protein A4U43_C05F29790 [Asparagus officinalis]|uniref:Reverse transcriptase zinc-binding domain-containing protein n=1 Tax=Asparagus officinalis TaxID=4686 RepID=A0A5P1EVK1_ASPOF|nr:uncharacterized protein A4U43_C05F29790 [Asparagus officinalis]
MVRDLVDVASNSWNTDLICASFDYTTSEAIIHTPIPHRTHNLDQAEDSLVLKGLLSPSFTTKAIYNLMWLGSHSHNNPLILELRTAMNILQVKVIPPLVKIFIWRALNNRLTPRDILVKHSMSIDRLCLLCVMDNETLDHLALHYVRVLLLYLGSGWLCSPTPLLPCSLAESLVEKAF